MLALGVGLLVTLTSAIANLPPIGKFSDNRCGGGDEMGNIYTARVTRSVGVRSLRGALISGRNVRCPSEPGAPQSEIWWKEVDDWWSVIQHGDFGRYVIDIFSTPSDTAYGWPLPALANSPILAPDAQPPTSSSDFDWTRLKAGGVVIPTRIVWRGLVANTLLFASTCFFPTITLRRLKTSLRARRGHCPHCAYDLNAHETKTCPECGHAVASPTSASSP